MRRNVHWRRHLFAYLIGFLLTLTSVQLSVAQSGPLEPITAQNADRLERLGTAALTERLEFLFSAGGRYLIGWNLRQPIVELWNVDTGQALGARTLQIADEYMRVLGATDETISTSSGLWALPNVELLLEYPTQMIGYHPSSGVLVSRLDDGIMLWQLTDDGIEAGASLQTGTDRVLSDSVRFTPDGTRLLISAFDVDDQLVTLLWDSATGEQLGRYVRPEGYFGVALTPTGDVLFTKRDGVELQVFDAIREQNLPEYIIPTADTFANADSVGFLGSLLVFSADGALAFNQRCIRVSAIRNDRCGLGELWLFEVETRSPLYSLEVADYNDQLFTIAPVLHPQKQLFIFQNVDFDIEFWGVASSDACRVTAVQTARLRRSPDASSEQVGGLASGDSQIAFAQATGADGYVWWGGIGGWVRSDLVSEAGQCESLPIIE